MEARPFYGAPVRMRWEGVAVRHEYERRDPLRGVFPQVRLTTTEGSWIVLDGEIENFDQLLNDVRARTPNASPGRERSWWRRVFYPG
jgi:hypothetical protein